MCALGTVCMRTVCALYALSALATRYAFGVKSWAHDNALAKIANFPCAGRAFPMRPPCVTGPLRAISLVFRRELTNEKDRVTEIVGFKICRSLYGRINVDRNT